MGTAIMKENEDTEEDGKRRAVNMGIAQLVRKK